MPSKRFLLAQFALWATYGLLRIFAAIPAIPEGARGAMAFADVVRATTGLLLTSLAWPALRRWIDPSSPWGWVLSGVAAVAISFLWMVVDRTVLVSLAVMAGIEIPWEVFPHGVDLGYGLMLVAWTTAVLFVMLLQREAQLRESLLAQQAATNQARLIALTNRLNPHFLFNSLNTIRAFAGENPERTREMITRLAAFLRHALTVDATSEATLAAELESVESYLWIEEARFEPKLVVEVDVDERARLCVVPPLVLQPLVENAVRHGDAGVDGLHRITVRAQIGGAQLRLSVNNTGVLRDPMVEGVGLTLTRERLKQMYGARQRVRVSANDGWVAVTIEIDNVVDGTHGERA